MGETKVGNSVRVLGIGGSTRAGSNSLKALRAVLSLAEEAGCEISLADIHTLELPLYNSDMALANYPRTTHWLLEEARNANAIVLCSPNYHGTLSGAVKNALDILDYLGSDNPPYFTGKPVGLVGLGGGAANVLNSLFHASRALNGFTVPNWVGLPHDAVDPESGKFRDAGNEKRAKAMVDQLVDMAKRMK